MLHKLIIRNFKGLEDVEIELGQAVVFVGGNNSGKTTALQALTLWELGLRKWSERRKGSPGVRSGVTINRRDLTAIPIPTAKLLWHGLHTHGSARIENKTKTTLVAIQVIVEGEDNGTQWRCGLEFDYANPEGFYCRPLREEGESAPSIPPEALNYRVALLPPMSGLAATEPRVEPGRINVLIGEGQTAQVLRNMCYRLYTEFLPQWSALENHFKESFGVTLQDPVYVKERGEVTMTYKDRGGIELDISSAGRGFQQTLLLLTYLYLNRGSVLLLDEPDAHLEIIRQREIYRLLTAAAREQNGQVIIASHSEEILERAADTDLVVAFIGKPHQLRPKDKQQKSQTLKALKTITAKQYFQAESARWVLFLEDYTDLDILRQFAKVLNHPAEKILAMAYFEPLKGNSPQPARDLFFGLKEAYDFLGGVILIDRSPNYKLSTAESALVELAWTRREIENYLCTPEVLLRFASQDHAEETMKSAIEKINSALTTLSKPDGWSSETKVSDDFLPLVFSEYYGSLQTVNRMAKRAFHILAGYIQPSEIDPEVTEKLDQIVTVAESVQLPTA